MSGIDRKYYTYHYPAMRINQILILLLSISAHSNNEQPAELETESTLEQPYSYVVSDEDGSGRLETSVKSFLKNTGSGPKVTLLATSHIGTASYYKAIQRLINQADWVLWEKVKSKPGDDCSSSDLCIPSCYKVNNAFGTSEARQRQAKDLKLEIQKLDYPKGRSVWADMTFKSFLQKILETDFAKNQIATIPDFDSHHICDRVAWIFNRGYNIPASQQAEMKSCMENNSEPFDTQSVSGRRKKIAKQTICGLKTGSFMPNLFPGIQELFVERRNDVVLRKLAQLLKTELDGEILIVYGAAHMKDIEKRFTEEHNYVLDREQRLVVLAY